MALNQFGTFDGLNSYVYFLLYILRGFDIIMLPIKNNKK